MILRKKLLLFASLVTVAFACTAPFEDDNVVVEPETDSDNPYELNAGSTCNVRITITNPSRRTDLFLLSCVDLPSSWYDIEYPEKQNISPGVVRKTEGLELNPKESGEIVLSIHPPQYAAAGNYFPTVQIHSNNRKELTIFEIIYPIF